LGIKVNNVNGTSDKNCKCGSWLDHWKKYGRQTTSYCSEVQCTKGPEVGAHVQKDSSTDTSWYIVPLCTSHNRETGRSLTLIDSVILVSANVSRTCG